MGGTLHTTKSKVYTKPGVQCDKKREWHSRMQGKMWTIARVEWMKSMSS